MDLSRLSDDDLLTRTPARPEAFGEFYARHETAILGYMLRRTDEPELAADLTAETFAAALVSIRRYRPGGAPAAAWLYGIARNVLLRSIKRRRVEDRARRRLAMDPLPLTEELLDRIERLGGDERVERLLAQLTPEQARRPRAGHRRAAVSGDRHGAPVLRVGHPPACEPRPHHPPPRQRGDLVTVFPELQVELVDAARRGHGRAPRTWRIARPVLVAAACAAAIVAIVLVAGRGTPNEEVPSPAATPAPTVLEQRFGVFRRPATAADTLPSVEALKRYWIHREDVADFDPSQARLVARDGDSQVFLVGWTFEGRPWINAVLFYRGEPRVGGGGVIGDRAVIGGVVEPPDGRYPAVVVAAVADGIGEVLVTYADHTTDHLPVRDNAVYAPLDRRPVSLAWDDANGVRHSEAVPIPPTTRSTAPAVATPTPTPTAG